ncbi:MAG: hypothetical protein GY711_26550 [bacterium]|nr:hypothetical protein [bacterium]
MAGGSNNQAGVLSPPSALNPTVCGGRGNEAQGDGATVSGGRGRSANGPDDWVAGSLFEDD